MNTTEDSHDKAIRLRRVSESPAEFDIEILGLRYDLSEREFADLCRQTAGLSHLVTGPYRPPYVVHIEIQYDDVDTNQTTQSYNLPAAFSTLEEAEEFQQKLTDELIFIDYDLVVDIGYGISSLPEDIFATDDLVPTTITANLDRLRACLLGNFYNRVGKPYFTHLKNIEWVAPPDLINRIGDFDNFGLTRYA